MNTPASIHKHPIHPMLVSIPLGLWVFSFICDFVYWIGWGGRTWADVSLYCMGGGIVGALVAAVPGLVDYQALTGRSRRIATFHMILNVSAVALFAANLLLRAAGAIVFGGSVAFSGIILVLLTVSGWLGGELVYVDRVGVTEREREEGGADIHRVA